MAEYIDREETKEWISDWLRNDKYWHPYSKGKNIPTAEVFDTLSLIPAADVVPRNAYNAIRWERDIMKKQLADIGKTLGQKMDDVQPVMHGRWVRDAVYVDETTGEPCLAWFCNQCGEPQMVGTNFCPNCGARMDGEDNG